ncbi:hypothetical protein JTE90_018475 [Oedothorax gibbosus]|uniref:Uncharacterized protein n=1 Tax=Oedothorax gibbosus TaxID=931172 RepID=A0AAV6UF70_9ARAC|nr:hypothetical protein JTE90_018475 [Oedothorax gibbosus]
MAEWRPDAANGHCCLPIRNSAVSRSPVSITVVDENDSPPRFETTPYKVSLSENAIAGHPIVTVSASDPDTEGSLTYMLVGKEDKFRLDPVTGVLYLYEPLDRETQHFHKVTVRAHDGVAFSEAAVLIEVLDSNDNSPMFVLTNRSIYSFDISEGTERGAQVGKLLATDSDMGVNKEISYAILSDYGNNVFSLNPKTGIFTLTSHLDYEEIEHYIFVCEAKDSGTPSLSSTVTVVFNVIDENDHAPLFDPMSYSDEIFENVTIGTSILKVSATDMDSGENGLITFDIVDGNTGNKFAINADGWIVTLSTLDRETKSLYSLTISATDKASDPAKRFSSTVNVNVIVKDVNDCVPEFLTPNITYVMENVPVNSVILAVNAVDKDEGRNSYVEYSLVSPQPLFSLGPIDGLLRVVGPIDREIKSEYTVTVLAKDRGLVEKSSTAEIKIVIADDNDHSPVFMHHEYSASVNENTAIGFSVLQLTASDMDEGLNAEVRYSIIAGDIDYYFTIEEDTGILRVAKDLDFETKSHYSLTIKAEDSGADSKHDTATVWIQIIDQNDNAPTFRNSPYFVHAVENAEELPVLLMVITAHDSDEVSKNQLQYRIKEGNRSIFSINSTTGELFSEKAFDREEEAQYTLQIVCIDSGSPSQTGTATVSILVEDRNDNVPQFEASKQYVASVVENLPVSSSIITVEATDKDIGRNSEILYSLLKVGNEENRFKIDPLTGTISTNVVLDREEKDSYNLCVEAHDLGLINQHPAITNVTITIEDDNDHTPEFTQSIYVVYIPDSAVGGHFVFGAVAEDKDLGLNSRIVYHLSGTDADKFYIDGKNGVLKLVDKLTNKSDGYQLRVHATDSGESPLSSTTLVNVFTQKSELFPKFQPGVRNFKFAESSKNLLVTKLSAVSPKADEAGKINYYIAGGNSGNAFTVGKESGEVMLVDVGLDRESISTYELLIEARDSDTPPLASAVRLEIVVSDINDNVPVFKNLFYNASVKEELEPPLFVIQVEATDADWGTNAVVEYHFLDANDKDNPFTLDSKTGEIFTTEVLDRETKDSYVVVVTAVDHGTPQKTSSATVFINVLDKNDNPPRFTRLFSANVTENAQIGSFVIQVTSSDRDINGQANASYSFTENVGGKFAIDPVSGKVTVAGSIDRELEDEYLLKVAAVDGSWRAETPLTVTIEDVNDNAPEFDLPEYTFNVPELMEGVSFIGKVSASDRDKKGPDSFVSYSLKRPSDLFRIDMNGNILSKQMLYYKKTLKGSSPENRHVIQVVASDNGKPALRSETTVNINVIDSNNNRPEFPSESYFSPIPESTAVGLSLFQVIAEDKLDVGVNAELEYHITSGNGTEYFSIHKKTGWVSVSSPLIGLKDKWFTVNIKATDKGVPPKHTETTGMFAITDENKFDPEFTALSYQVVIPENEPLLSEIVTVTATDKDKGFNGEIMYSILSGNLDNHFQISPHTGTITIAKHLDFETITTYHLNILASDRGFKSRNSTAVLNVLVTDVNDNPPVYNSTRYEVYIFENEPQGTYVTQLIALDADSARNSIIEYSIPEGDHSYFKIDSKTGVLTSSAPFDFEEKTKYSVKVIASNVGTLLFTSTILDIYVIGRNEYYPHFVQPVFQFAVSESAALGTTVGRLEALDEDAGLDGEIFFFFVGSSNDKGFEMEKRTGVIKVSRVLDRESQSRVVLTVLAKNTGSIRGNDTDEAQVVISIQDGNDPPIFSKEIYEARVSEAAPIETSVVNVSAVDKDVHPNNNQFLFSIYSGNVEEAFSIDPQSGAIFTARHLDRETHSVYNLTITATDSGNPPQSGSTLVIINIDDVNDNGPMFVSQEVVGYILENEPAYTSVMMLSVTDQDLPPNGPPFKFFLVGGEHKDYFELNSHTGLVKTTKSLDRETTPVLKIVVEIQDNGKPPMSSQNLVKIVVLDKNDCPSSSRPLTILVWVHNKSLPSRKIADVHPQDLDTVGQYQCQIVEGNSAIFRIPKNCDLHAKAKVDSPATYSLTVRGNDGKHRNVSSTIKVKFLTFDNATFENSISIRIFNFSAEAFLAMYDNFLHVLNNIFKSSSQPILYSIVNVDGHLELTLASKLNEHLFMPPSEVLSILEQKSTLIKKDSLENITFGYDPCEASPCQNKGVCSSFLEMKEFLSIVDSPSLIFTSPFVSRKFLCQCPSGFSGSTCQNQQDPCLPNPCSSGSTCHKEGTTFRCACAPQFEGKHCDVPRKESCTSSVCKNGGTCQESPNGGFFCLCRPGFKGLVCEQTADACRPNRCLNGATCVSENLGYHCLCASNYFGKHCEKSSYGFHPYSYMAFSSLPSETNDISIVFAMKKFLKNALLVYQFGAQSGGRSDFLALEIINSIPTLSFGGSRTAITRISVNFTVAGDKWHKVTVIRNGKVASLSVVSCNQNGVACEECLLGNSTCSKSATGDTGTLNFGNNPMYVGGVPTVDPLLERPNEVLTNDFIGCIHALSVNGREIDMNAPLKSAFITSSCSRKENSCTAATCGEGGTCVGNQFAMPCRCNSDVIAASCVEANKPYSIGGGSFLELIPEEKHRRTLLLLDKKHTKESSFKTLKFHLRSYSKSGVVLFSGNNDEHTILELKDGRIFYSTKMKSSEELVEELNLPSINDGKYHTIALSSHTRPGKYSELNISVDDYVLHNINSKDVLHDFLDPYVSSITIGGKWDQLTDVTGCVKLITVNNEAQVENDNYTSYFKLYHRGNPHSTCQNKALGIDNVTTDPLSIGVILVISFFAVLLVVILVSFLVFRKRKLKNKNPSFLQKNKENGNVFMEAETHRTHECTNYMPEDLVPKKMKDPRDTEKRPDIIENPKRIEEAPLSHTPHVVNESKKKTENFIPNSEVDFYDLDNSSSIAPSDMNDVSVYYKMYKKTANKVPSYNHRHSPNQFHSRGDTHSPRNILHKPHPLTKRDSPFSHTEKMQNTPLARLSPSSELSEAAVRILTLKDISGKPLQKALLATAQGVGSKQFQDPLTNSDRSLNSPVSNLSHSTSSMQSGHQNVNKLKPRDNGITLGLTTEEIERLNARPRNLSLVSTLDAVSSSSDDNAEKHKLAELLESNTELLEAQDSSTDESGNDSFTCSEFEYDNYDKVHREFGPRNMIFSKLAEEDNENDEDYAKNYDGFDSFRGSFSTLVASDDESSNPPPYKPANGSMLGWDCLLNWGPNFENLVGVFKDIEQLPDNVNSSGPGHSQTDEDYV